MISYVKYRMALRRLLKAKAQIRDNYGKHIAAARSSKNWDELRATESEAWHEEAMVDEEIALLTTDFLLSQARKHFIEPPSRKEEEMWDQCNKISQRYVLTNAGISSLRSKIRAEAKERRELFLPIVAALTGIIGSITGLIAVMKK